MASQSYECASCVHHDVESHKEPCRNCASGCNYSPITQRSGGTCECAALRHQLRLADELAKAAVEHLHGWGGATLNDALRIYSEARIQAEVTAPITERRLAQEAIERR